MTTSRAPETDPRVVRSRRILGAALLLLLLLHVVPVGGDPTWIVFGVLPWDLVYHVLWIVLATAFVSYMTSTPWPDEPPPPYQPPVDAEPEADR